MELHFRSILSRFFFPILPQETVINSFPLFLHPLPSFSCSRIHRTLEESSQRQQSSTKTGRNRGGIARGRVVKTWRMKSRRTKQVRTSVRQKERKREKGQRNQALLFRFSRALINYVFTAVKGGERERERGQPGKVRWAGHGASKKRRAIIPQLLEISVSINLVSPRLRRRRCFAPWSSVRCFYLSLSLILSLFLPPTRRCKIYKRGYVRRESRASFEFRAIDSDELISSRG